MQKAIDRIEDRLRSMEVKCDDIERHSRNLNLEFTELYDKVSHQMSRMAKRYARQQKADGVEGEEVVVDEPGDGVDPISRSILARRHRIPTE